MNLKLCQDIFRRCWDFNPKVMSIEYLKRIMPEYSIHKKDEIGDGFSSKLLCEIDGQLVRFDTDKEIYFICERHVFRSYPLDGENDIFITPRTEDSGITVKIFLKENDLKISENWLDWSEEDLTMLLMLL